MCNICQQPRFPPLVPVLRWHLQWRVEGGGGTEWSTEDVARHGLGQTQVIILINLCVNMSDQHRPSSTKKKKERKEKLNDLNKAKAVGCFVR